MIDTTEMDRDPDRKESAVMYVGKRLYTQLVEIQQVLHDARKAQVDMSQLGTFGAWDMKALIDEAGQIGQVPNWRTAAKFEYKTDVFRDRK